MEPIEKKPRRAKLAKVTVSLVAGPDVVVEVTTARGILGICSPPDGSGGYLLVHVPTGLVAMRTNRKLEAQEVRSSLEALDWTDPAARRDDVRTAMEKLRCCKQE